MTEQNRHYRERRIQIRYPVDLHAKVRGRNQLPTNCRVRNICNGGVLIESAYTDPELPFQPGEHVDIHFDLPDAQSMDPVQAIIEIVHRVDRGLGARFVRLAADGRSRLARYVSDLAATTREASNEAGATPASARAREVLEEVGQKRLGGLLDSLLESLVDELWNHAERAESDTERARFSGEVGLLAKAVHNESVAERLRQELLDALKNVGSPQKSGEPSGPREKDAAPGGLQLVDPKDFEIWLAKSELANKLEDELREPLEALRTHVAAIFHDASLPMEPMALAETIERALGDLGLGVDLQRVALQVVSGHLVRNLGAFYRELLRAWTLAGISELEESAAASGYSPAPGAGGAGAPVTDVAAPVAAPEPAPVSDVGMPEPVQAASSPPAGAASSPSVPELNATLTRAAGAMANILSHYPQRAPYIGVERRGAVYTSGGRVADLLASLPSGYQFPEPDPRRPLRELVSQWLTNAEAKVAGGTPKRQPVLSPQVEERVDVTDRLLALMLADGMAPQRLKSLIRPLSKRFLSMALTEPGAVADDRQPLVDVINKLEHLATYLQNDEAIDPNLKKGFDEVVRKLVTTTTGDRKTLDELGKQVGDLQSRAGREYQDNIANWVNICESKERARLAREEVRARINDTFGGRRTHKVVAELLEVGWRNLLDLVCANSGVEAPRWIRHWRLLCALNRATAGEAVCDGDPRLDLDALIDEARSGLLYMGVDPIVGDDLLARIETAVHRVQVSLARDEDYDSFAPLKPDPENEPDQVPHDLPASDWERALETVSSLAIGSLIWMRAKDANKAMRLIWRNDDGTRLAVTDTMGRKVKVLRRSRLVDAFARGHAQAQAPTAKRIVTRAADAALSEMQQRLKYHETHDPLTGLSNQRQLLGALTRLLLPAGANGKAHALGFLELDRYDTLTGTYGYSVGERMLVAVARLLEGVVSEAVCLAYMGGSRFGILMPVMDVDHASEIGESIRAGLSVMPFELQGKPFRITGSIGLVMLGGDNTSPEQIISAASVASLAAQREGGDRVILFHEENAIIARQLDHMRGWAQAEDVIKAGRRKLRYQRIVPLDPAAELSPHCEILLSVYDDQGIPLPLQSFIAAAEAFNMMREVDRQVIEETFGWVHRNPDKVREIGGVAINLSGQSLSDPDLIKYIRAGLSRFEIPVDLVSFEVTETAAIVNLDQAAIILEDIKSLGCQIALDDFGAGMSSYSYLKRLPVDYVKIDGSFVKDILVSPQDREIVKSFNEIAHFMGKRTIAEYVENEEIMELLRDIGVDYAQGYAIEKPRFIDEIL